MNRQNNNKQTCARATWVPVPVQEDQSRLRGVADRDRRFIFFCCFFFQGTSRLPSSAEDCSSTLPPERDAAAGAIL